MRRSVAGRLAIVGACALVLGWSRAADSYEAFDGRLQMHGYLESVVRTINSDFSDDWDLTQWQQVLNLELEFDIAPEGFGPVSALSAYARFEARYDCVWTRACGIGTSADTYGDRAKGGPYYFLNGNDVALLFRGTAFADNDPAEGGRIHPGKQFITVADHPLFATIFDSEGVDQELGTPDDPGPFIFGDLADYTLADRRVRGPVDGQTIQILGPWKPKQDIFPIGALRHVPNPFSPLEVNPLTGLRFTGAKPFRPFPKNLATGNAPLTDAQGYYLPSPGLQRTLMEERFSPFDQNFHQWELAWNRGGSQQDEKELKELYFDMEFLDGRLYVRLGKQVIVWGKTEIFRSQDQFNPQDLALSTLPSLEESRIGLWAAKAIWSFYDIGPLEDVRLELAALLDDFEPADLGRCGEPYAPFPSCQKAFGLYIHGVAGLGLAGEIRPEAWWNSSRGLEGGGRLEFRWSRFSFALSDFYGFDDFPYTDPIHNFERNVDPRTGRPRFANVKAGCDPEGLFDGETSGCLGDPRNDRLAAIFQGNAPPIPILQNTPGRIPEANRQFSRSDLNDQIRRNHSANQTLFHLICGGTVGFTNLFPGLEQECSFSVFGSGVPISVGAVSLTVAEAIGHVFAGSGNLTVVFQALGLSLVTSLPVLPPLVPLNILDGRTGEGRVGSGTVAALIPVGNLSGTLTPEQQALLGCGAFYGTSCDSDGVDLMNAEASALLQSFPAFDGTPLFDFSAFRGPQPGTVGFNGGPVCTRFERGRTFILPGCRGPGDPGYDPRIDGNPVFNTRFNFLGGPDGSETTTFNALGQAFRAAAGLRQCPPAVNGVGQRLYHPFTCQPFRSEMAALSFNFLMLAVIFSQDLEGDFDLNDPEAFDRLDPKRLFATNRCSFAAPQFCTVVRDLFAVTAPTRNDIRAGGNWQFGRRDFTWHTGQELALRYGRRNILGASVDFAEDRTKTNWSLEATWFESTPVTDRESPDGITEADIYSLTVSVDRPTFVNFLNANRTLFINTQWFFTYTPQYTQGEFNSNGPLNALATLTIFTGYFQDRLNPAITFVYDIQSDSGAVLPSLSYRFTEAFSAQFGLAFFWGRFQFREPYLVTQAPGNRVGRHAYDDFVENGLAIVRDREEAFLRLKWTF